MPVMLEYLVQYHAVLYKLNEHRCTGNAYTYMYQLSKLYHHSTFNPYPSLHPISMHLFAFGSELHKAC